MKEIDFSTLATKLRFWSIFPDRHSQIVGKTLLFRGPINDGIPHGIDNKLIEAISAQIIIFLSAKTSLWFKAKSPLKLDLDPIFLSRELLFQGTIS